MNFIHNITHHALFSRVAWIVLLPAVIYIAGRLGDDIASSDEDLIVRMLLAMMLGLGLWNVSHLPGVKGTSLHYRVTIALYLGFYFGYFMVLLGVVVQYGIMTAIYGGTMAFLYKGGKAPIDVDKTNISKVLISLVICHACAFIGFLGQTIVGLFAPIALFTTLGFPTRPRWEALDGKVYSLLLWGSTCVVGYLILK